MAEAQLRVVQVRSGIGTKPKHRGTLRALGLGRVGRAAVLPDRPEIRGMVARVAHLVEVGGPAPASTGDLTEAGKKAAKNADKKAELKADKKTELNADNKAELKADKKAEQ